MEFRCVSVDDLIVGRQLQFPILDVSGLLLLAESSVLTAEFKQKLKSRQMAQVKVSAADFACVTLAEETYNDFKFDTKFTKRIDQLLESGGLFVQNDGPALRESFVKHGCRGYDSEQQERLRDDHPDHAANLESMIEDAVQGRRLDVLQLTSLAGSYIADMVCDSDMLLHVVNDVSDDHNIAQRCLHMAVLGMAIGAMQGFDEENIRNIALAGLVHDWGMAKVPEEIQTASHVLSEVEFLEIKKHAIHSLELLENVSGLPQVVSLVCYQVHERPNGHGYPRGRKSHTIHPFARVLGVADRFVGLTSPRPYRSALKPYAAMECLLKQSKAGSVDPDSVRALLNILGLFPIGSYVALSDSRVARVLRTVGENYVNPIVQIIQDRFGKRLDPNDPRTIIDLSQEDVHIVQTLSSPGQVELSLSDEIFHQHREIQLV